jgi:hypothetical protein
MNMKLLPVLQHPIIKWPLLPIFLPGLLILWSCQWSIDFLLAVPRRLIALSRNQFRRNQSKYHNGTTPSYDISETMLAYFMTLKHRQAWRLFLLASLVSASILVLCHWPLLWVIGGAVLSGGFLALGAKLSANRQAKLIQQKAGEKDAFWVAFRRRVRASDPSETVAPSPGEIWGLDWTNGGSFVHGVIEGPPLEDTLVLSVWDTANSIACMEAFLTETTGTQLQVDAHCALYTSIDGQ